MRTVTTQYTCDICGDTISTDIMHYVASCAPKPLLQPQSGMDLCTKHQYLMQEAIAEMKRGIETKPFELSIYTATSK